MNGIIFKLILIAGMVLVATSSVFATVSAPIPATVSAFQIDADTASRQVPFVDLAVENQLDMGEENVPVIVIFREHDRKEIENFDLKCSYSLINGMAGSASSSVIQDLADDPSIAAVYLDGTVEIAQPVNLSEDNRTICSAKRLDVVSLWDEGIDGSGVVVAILDSGIDKNHPDLAGKVIGEKNFVDYERTADDLLGHGTAVAGIIAGSGAASGGKYKGVAPGASLLNVRVIDSSGGGQISDIIAGIEWALDNDADVLSMSLGGLNLGETNPPISMASDNAVDSGAVVCVAAGNLDERLLLLMLVASSVCLGCVESPGDGVKVITVGATDCDNKVAMFSGTGPLRDGRIKPTVMAPGVNVITTVPPDVEVDGRIDSYYVGSSGTSLATPVAAGLAALLLQANPDLTPAGVKAAMTKGAIKLNNSLGEEYESYYQGAGILNAPRSLALVNESHLCGVMPDHWSAGRWVYGDVQIVGDSAIYGSLDTGADRSQKKIYSLAPGDADWSTRFLFFTDKELKNVTTKAVGPVSDFANVQPLPRTILANAQTIFGVSINIPQGASPGIYEGFIEISESGTLMLSVPLSVEVADPVEIFEGRGTESGKLDINEWDYYYVDVPSGTDDIRSVLNWEGDADLDLFMLSPTSEHYPAEPVDSFKKFSQASPASGRWLVAVHPKNATQEAEYCLSFERSLFESKPERWSLGTVEPGEVKVSQFRLENDGPALRGVNYEGVVEGVRTEQHEDVINDKMVWPLPIEVTQNATRLSVKLNWDDDDTQLALILFNPSGRPVDVSYGGGVGSEDVGASNPVPGTWRVWVYGFNVQGASQPFELLEILYTQESWSWVSAVGPSKLESGSNCSINATLKVPDDASGKGVEGYIRIQAQNESFSIPITFTVAGAALTGDARADLLDKDGDGLFERLCIDVGIEVTVPGDYRVEGSLVDGNGTAIKWMSSTGTLDGDGSIEICVDGAEIWKKGECGPLKLENLILYNEGGDIIDRREDDVLVHKCPQDFQSVSAQFSGSFVDQTAGVKASKIEIDVGVSVYEPGLYVVSARLADDDGFEIDNVEVAVDLAEGDQTVSLKFSPVKFIMKQKPSSLHLEDLSLSRNDQELNKLDDAWSTEVYHPSGFTTARKMIVIG